MNWEQEQDFLIPQIKSKPVIQISKIESDQNGYNPKRQYTQPAFMTRLFSIDEEARVPTLAVPGKLAKRNQSDHSFKSAST